MSTTIFELDSELLREVFGRIGYPNTYAEIGFLEKHPALNTKLPTLLQEAFTCSAREDFPTELSIEEAFDHIFYDGCYSCREKFSQLYAEAKIQEEALKA